jgi:DNA-binding beta-propeller fold protein YncE
MVTRTVAGRTYDFSHAMGRGGVGAGFNSGNSLAFSSDNLVYVLSRGGEAVTAVSWDRTARGARITKFDVGAAAGDEKFIQEFGQNGRDRGQLIWPAGLALDSNDNIYVSDEWMNRINVFDTDGNLLRDWGSEGTGDGEFDGPSGLVMDKQDNLYVVDSRNHRVQKFTSDGRFLAQFGGPGDGEGRLNLPWGITLDREGYLYVADTNNHRVQKLTKNGDFVNQFGSYGTGRGELNHPSDVAVDPDGDVYVCDWGNDRVQAFDAAGRFFTSFVGDARELTLWSAQIVNVNPEAVKKRREVKDIQAEWRLRMPRAVAFDVPNHRLLVLDTQRNRIQIYNKLKEYTSPARNL